MGLVLNTESNEVEKVEYIYIYLYIQLAIPKNLGPSFTPKIYSFIPLTIFINF